MGSQKDRKKTNERWDRKRIGKGQKRDRIRMNDRWDRKRKGNGY